MVYFVVCVQHAPLEEEAVLFQGLRNSEVSHPGVLDSEFWVEFAWGLRVQVLCSFEVGSYLRLTDFVYHSTLALRATKKKKKFRALR